MTTSHSLAFEEARPILFGLAYRILGSRADAEDAVQDTFLKWQAARRDEIETPAAWLTTICTRRCIDLLRAAHRARTDYVGPWLPEPLHTPIDDTPEAQASLSRARANVDQAKVRHVTAIDRQERLLAAFETAVASGSTTELATLLSDDIELRADSGGKATAVREVLRGKAQVLDFIGGTLHPAWKACRRVASDINGGRAVILLEGGKATACVAFAYDDAAKATDIYITRNPDKLSRLTESLEDVDDHTTRR